MCLNNFMCFYIDWSQWNAAHYDVFFVIEVCKLMKLSPDLLIPQELSDRLMDILSWAILIYYFQYGFYGIQL